MAYTDPAAVDAALAFHLKQDGTDESPSPALRPGALADAIDWAYSAIVSRLLSRGYSQSQVDAWDYRVEFNKSVAIYWLLVNVANLDASTVWVDKFDRRAELDTLSLIVGGVVVTPATQAGQVGHGRLDRTGDLIPRNTTAITRW